MKVFMGLVMFLMLKPFWDSIIFVMSISFSLFLVEIAFEGLKNFIFFDLMMENLVSLSYWIVILMVLSMTLTFESNKMSMFYVGMSTSLLVFLLLAFSTTSLFLFYIFFELSVIPVFLMILGWGVNTERLQAGLYMFLYTLIFSLPFLLYLIKFNSLNMTFFYLSMFYILPEQMSILWCFMMFMVFMVKFPMYFMHLWLPKAHVEAPVGGSMILAGVLLKLGGYGLIRLSIASLNELNKMWVLFYSFGMMGSLIMSFICLRQVDLKCFVAYTSVAHMGLVISSLFVCSFNFWLGGVIMMLAHGLASSGLFYGLNLYYERFFTRSLMMLKGGMGSLPLFSFWWFILCMGSMSSPPTMNFFSELFMMMSLLNISNINFLLFFLLMLMSGVYSVFLFVSFTHGNFLKSFFISMLSTRELLIFFSHIFPLIIFLFKLFL